MTNRYCIPSTDGNKGTFSDAAAPMKPTRFTSGGHMPPTKNPAQPHLGLGTGPYTHGDAARASNEVTSKQSAPARKPGTQATLETPAPSMSTKASTQAGSRTTTSVKPDGKGFSSEGYPKGKE